MTIHFGVLIPSTNTTTETEFSRLPAGYQAHYARVLTSTPGRPFAPGRDEDVDYQSKLLATAKVRMIALIQTSASLFAEDYDAVTMQRMSAASGVPSVTSALAVGRAVRALGAGRVALISPYSPEVNERAQRYFSGRHGVEVAALDGFAATDSYAIGNLGPENARAAMLRLNRPDLEAFVIPGANFATMASIAGWEAEFRKPIVTSSQAALWAIARELGGERIAGHGRLLETMPAG
jgi:maleate cis-trans isomerase